MFDWHNYSNFRISPTQAAELRHADVLRHLEHWQAEHPQSLEVKPLGKSVEGRQISLLTVGTGAKKVFAWSQMHGDEPTHTAALLDLVNFLLVAPQDPSADAILRSCKLHLIIMLNPDGAERWTRRNAQQLDINRDALQLQTPEGRILHELVRELQPEFALNLHNQRPRTTVAGMQRVAAFSLLVPPIDEAETNTEHVVRAKRLAGHVARVVAPHCPGPVSRYDADFMPRCFGEWVQQQGTATITIEAGGWTTVDAEPLVQLHFHGLVNCLEAIANGEFSDVSTQIYEGLPRTGEHDLFDSLLRDVTVLSGNLPKPFRADVGIDLHRSTATPQAGSNAGAGTIRDLGDLSVNSGKTITELPNLICLPGKIVWQPTVTPTMIPSTHTLTTLLSAGVTTLIGELDLSNAEEVVEFERLTERLPPLPLNLGFVAKCGQWSDDVRGRLLTAIAQGILGVSQKNLPDEAKEILQAFQLPLVSEDMFPSLENPTTLLGNTADQIYQCTKQLGIADRGKVCLGGVPDLCLVLSPHSNVDTLSLNDCDLQQVLVGGNVVYERGALTRVKPGVLLRRRCGQV